MSARPILGAALGKGYEPDRTYCLWSGKPCGQVIDGMTSCSRHDECADPRMYNAALADAERLEWFAKNCLRDASMRFEDGSFKAVKAWSIASHRDDLREAIDAARSAQKVAK